jgi:hypothetical protein
MLPVRMQEMCPGRVLRMPKAASHFCAVSLAAYRVKGPSVPTARVLSYCQPGCMQLAESYASDETRVIRVNCIQIEELPRSGEGATVLLVFISDMVTQRPEW